MKRAQSTVEFIFVVLFFLIIITVLIISYLQLMPSEISKVREQEACSKAEVLAEAFFKYRGNHSEWELNNNLTLLGLSNGTAMNINYTKWEKACEIGYREVINKTNTTHPFYLSYNAYAFEWKNESIPDILPNGLTPRVFILRNNTNLLVYAGSNSTKANLYLKLYFVDTITSLKECDVGSLESKDTNTSSVRAGGSEVEFWWSFSDGDLDCVNISLPTIPKLIYIKDMRIDNSTNGQKYSIYLGNHTVLNNYFGSAGYIDVGKNYCEIARVGLLVNRGETIPIYLNVLSW